MKTEAEIGIFGGSGFEEFADNLTEVRVETPYGPPSDSVMVGDVAGRKVAFLPRHGRGHLIPPHRINFRANLWAMRELGVTRIIGPCAAGSLQAHVELGSFVVCDQYVDRTSGRVHTFYDGPVTTHASAADPYCSELRPIVVTCARDLGIEVHDGGTVVVIEGPRFSTKAESKWFTSMGWEVINMTQYPECHLARELEMCYVNVSLITDYDSGLVAEGTVAPVTHADVLRTFASNAERVKQLCFRLIEAIPESRSCSCGSTLASSR
jgi:5'-methylthioadenosine phosphorylase